MRREWTIWHGVGAFTFTEGWPFATVEKYRRSNSTGSLECNCGRHVYIYSAQKSECECGRLYCAVAPLGLSHDIVVLVKDLAYDKVGLGQMVRQMPPECGLHHGLSGWWVTHQNRPAMAEWPTPEEALERDMLARGT
jgi:hypothetical protein